MPLTKKDFDYYKGFIGESIEEHRKQMKDLNQPDEVIASYEGRLVENDGQEYVTTGNITEDYLFIATNTVAPTLYYQMPKPMIKALPGGSPYSAEVLNGMARAYMADAEKKEIQMCILDAFLPYGYGVAKIGYNSRRGTAKKPSIFTAKTEGKKFEDIESTQEYLKYEKSIVLRHSPNKTYLDHTQGWNKDQRVTFEYTRNLKELKDSNLYPLSSNFLNHFKTQGDGDDRKVKLTLFEHWIMINGYAWKLVYIDQWHEELCFGKSKYQTLPMSLLRFNNTPDRKYVTSHGNLGYKAQKELDYQNGIWKSHIDHIRRNHILWKDAFEEQDQNTFKANIIDSVIWSNQPLTAGVYQQVSSNPMGSDMYANMENTRAYLKLLLSTTGGKGGEPDSKLATTEKSKQVGDMMRTAGMQDAIRDFNRDILKKVIKNVIDFGDPKLTIEITKKDVIDPTTGTPITGKKLEIGGDNGFNLKEEIEGDLDLDYLYDIDIASAARPDFAVIRKQLGEAIQLAVGMRPLLQEKGKDIAIDDLLKDYFNTFDTIPNPQKYIIDMTDKEQVAYKQQQELMRQQEALKNMSAEEAKLVKSRGAPTEQAIQTGAERVAV